MAQPGFEINGTVYPYPTSFEIGDWVLIEELTGLTADRFAEMVDESSNSDGGVLAGTSLRPLVGLLGVAVWRKNPRWTRDKVRQFVEHVDFENLQMVAGDDPNVPPEKQPAGASRSAGTSNESTNTQEG